MILVQIYLTHVPSSSLGATILKAQEGLHSESHQTCLDKATLLLSNKIGYHFGCIRTKSNVIANDLSQILSVSSLKDKFPHFLVQAPSLTGPWCYIPNAAIISLIMVTLLWTGSTDPLATSRLLLTTLGNLTSYPGAKP